MQHADFVFLGRTGSLAGTGAQTRGAEHKEGRREVLEPGRELQVLFLCDILLFLCDILL